MFLRGLASWCVLLVAAIPVRAHRVGLRFALPLHGFMSQYVAEISVGTPPQRFQVLFDSGSCNTWLFSSECNSITCKRHRRFDPRQSSTHLPNGTELTVRYGSGSIESVLAYDDFRVGSARIRRQAFAEVYATQGNAFLTGIIDGIVGLALPKMSVASIRPG